MRVVLVTGGARRVGRSVCEYFAGLGWQVAFSYFTSEDEALELTKQINALSYKANLFDPAEGVVLMEKVVRDLGRVDLVVNNASIFDKSSLKTCKIGDLDDNFALHFKTPLFIIQKYHQICQETKFSGHVVNIIDSNVNRKNTVFFNYLLSKKSLLELTHLAAAELAPLVRVNAVLPGFVMQDKHMLAEDVEKEINRIPLKRQANTDEISRAILFLHENKYVTGEAIAVDGGKRLF